LARRHHLGGLATCIGPSSREAAYAVQAQLEGLSPHPLFGWKIAATSTAGQQHIGIDGPIAGRLLTEMV
jgi:2-keto-4-pentenoate hydratase